MRPVSVRRPGAALLVVSAGAVLLAACDADPVTTTSTAATVLSSASSPAPSATTSPTSPTGPGTGSSAPAPTVTVGPATPTAAPGTFAIAVAGAGQVTYPVSGVRCGATTVTGTVTAPGGGSTGTVGLDAGTGVLTVSGLAPLDGTRLTGSTNGTPGARATVRWTGDGTGSAASFAVTCP